MAKECTEWFGYTLRRLVESSGLSYRQLAARCGCTEGCISRIANGNVGMPSLSIAKGMADAFGMTLDVYATADPEAKRRAAAVIDGMI